MIEAGLGDKFILKCRDNETFIVKKDGSGDFIIQVAFPVERKQYDFIFDKNISIKISEKISD